MSRSSCAPSKDSSVGRRLGDPANWFKERKLTSTIPGKREALPAPDGKPAGQDGQPGSERSETGPQAALSPGSCAGTRSGWKEASKGGACLLTARQVPNPRRAIHHRHARGQQGPGTFVSQSPVQSMDGRTSLSLETTVKESSLLRSRRQVEFLAPAGGRAV
ncbi:uncharacterized protein AAG666_013688 [Megaptera novaeangliae]